MVPGLERPAFYQGGKMSTLTQLKGTEMLTLECNKKCFIPVPFGIHIVLGLFLHLLLFENIC